MRPPPGTTLATLAAVALATVALALPAAAHAARPLVTDDARLLDPRSCQVESWFRRDRHTDEAGLAPGCNPTGDAELTLGYSRSREDGAPDVHQFVGQAKTVFKPVDTNGWGIGAVGGAFWRERPRDERKFANFYAYVPVTFSLADDAVFVHVNAGLERDRIVNETHALWGLATEWQASAAWTLLAETYGVSGERAQWQAGVRFAVLPQRFEVFSTLGGPYGRGRDATYFSVGLRLATPALW